MALEAVTAPIRPLAWEPPYAVGAALEMAKRQKKKQQQRKKLPYCTSTILQQKTSWKLGVPIVAQWLTNPTRNHEVAGSVPALAQWVNDPELP